MIHNGLIHSIALQDNGGVLDSVLLGILDNAGISTSDSSAPTTTLSIVPWHN